MKVLVSYPSFLKVMTCVPLSLMKEHGTMPLYIPSKYTSAVSGASIYIRLPCTMDDPLPAPEAEDELPDDETVVLLVLLVPVI